MEKTNKEAFSLLFLINRISTYSSPSICPHFKKDIFALSQMESMCLFVQKNNTGSKKNAYYM